MILLDQNARPVIGHRGNRAHAPENTLESLQEAVVLGVDAVEFDVQVSSDGVLLLMHDLTIDRTTSGSGAVATQTFATLRAHDAGARFTVDGGRSFPWRDRGVVIPSFDDVVEALPSTLPLIVELKTPAASAALLAAITRHGLQKRVIVAGFESASTQPLRGQGFALGASTPDVARLLWPSLLRRRIPSPWYQALCIPPTYNGVPLPISAIARAVRHARVVTHVWTVNDAVKATQLWSHGVQGIISDDPATILAARAGAAFF
ncbi:glycerophosphodiester phosphodiesterase family protein [Gemmatimonas sp.]|uniref:glycerophosphodiester phosphodiesterase family protein n=1 Tax=Gemmatimonas sp. TaxID=1962908 RepID=UPI00286D83AC|nr:glycerophosphodiester phosphodiesterase family protein [Gemmatimonas sp.]